MPKYIDGHLETFETETEEAIRKRKLEYDYQEIKTFVTPKWTLEYSLALSAIRKAFYKSMLYAKKIKNSDEYALTNSKIEEVDSKVEEYFEENKDKTEEEIAYYIYHDVMLNPNNSISKAITAQCLANYLRWRIVKKDGEQIEKEKMFDYDLYQTALDEDTRQNICKKLERDKYLKYLVDAIKHAVGKE